MSQLICVSVTEDRAIPRLRTWRKSDQLTPAPPKRWLLMIRLPRIPDGLSIGAWLCALWEIHRHEAGEERGRGFHMIARDAFANRFLLVHPKLRSFAEEQVEGINGAMTNCNCGGSDCLAGAEQFRALQVLGRRVWDRLTPGKRMQLVKDYEGDRISVAVALSPHAEGAGREQRDADHVVIVGPVAVPADRRAAPILGDECLLEAFGRQAGEGCGAIAQRQQKFRDRVCGLQAAAVVIVAGAERHHAALAEEAAKLEDIHARDGNLNSPEAQAILGDLRSAPRSETSTTMFLAKSVFSAKMAYGVASHYVVDAATDKVG